MIDELERKIAETAVLNSKLILLIGPPKSGKTRLLTHLSDRVNAPVLNVGHTLGHQLLELPRTKRHLHVPELFRKIANGTASNGLLLVDNIELLFDKTLRLSPFDALRAHARMRPVVAAWPGDTRENRLTYAVTGHPEYQDYSAEGAILFNMH